MLGQVQYQGPPLSLGEFKRGVNDFLAGRKPRGRWSVKEWQGHIRRGRYRLGKPGIVKQYADPFLTMIDIDRARPLSWDRIAFVARRLNAGVRWVRFDRTARGWHVLIRWSRRWSPAETVAIQAILGSDWRREVFNLSRSSHPTKTNRWNMLFRRKLK